MNGRSSPITRRRFLTLGGMSAVWVATGCESGSTLAEPTTSTTTTTASLPPTTRPPSTTTTTTTIPEPTAERVLVVVQLLGGNDALNTVVPADGRYRSARPSLAIAESELLPLPGAPDDLALHPALAPLMPLWDEGTMSLAVGVAFDEQTRSHFESRDVWWRASDDQGAAGWLARWIEAAAIDSPEEPLEAIALGLGARALAGSTASAVRDPNNFELAPPSGVGTATFEEFLLAAAIADRGESELLTAARGSLPATLSVQKIIEGVTDDSAGDEGIDEDDPGLGTQLRTAASLIASRPGLRVVTVGISGFDTHANQRQTHADLLDETATAIAGFWGSLEPEDQDRTMLLTTSEFGRRVAQNGSAGTDHGLAGVHLVVGGGVNGGQVVGEYDFDGLVDGDLPIKMHGEELFAEGLRWLGGPVEEVLGQDPDATGLVSV